MYPAYLDARRSNAEAHARTYANAHTHTHRERGREGDSHAHTDTNTHIHTLTHMLPRWVVVYPAYINAKKSIPEGRKLPIDKCVDNPTAREFLQAGVCLCVWVCVGG